MKLRDIPNIITILRLVILVPFVYCLAEQLYVPAFYLVLAAGFSDGADGYLARKFNWKSKFGAFADPMADKIMVTSSYFLLGLLGKIPIWLMVVVLLRDAIIAGGVLAWHLRFGKVPMDPSFLSKVNTTLQILLVLAVLCDTAYASMPQALIAALIISTAITTVLSLINYTWIWGRRAYFKAKSQHA